MTLMNDNNEKSFIEVDYHQGFKYSQIVGGDVFLSHKLKDENRVISVLSDGLGSGVKANVLATLTATMAVNFISSYKDIRKTAETIMRTLPVCKVRKISYSTFTIVDIDSYGKTRIIEFDNPPFLIIRDNKIFPVSNIPIKLNYRKYKENILNYAEFIPEMGDRIVFFSDGVSQSGIGTKNYPLGWGNENVRDYVISLIKNNNSISARELSQCIINKAYTNDGYKPKDDITCGVVYFRKPRKLMILTGPPVSREKDKEISEMINKFNGKKIICGGTTAKIVSRELNREVKINFSDQNPDVPPSSYMDGMDLITEGTITLSKVLEILEQNNYHVRSERNAADRLVNYILDSDIIHFTVGTKINEAHQDPNIPLELGIRRNLIKSIVNLLEEKYLKETKLQFV